MVLPLLSALLLTVLGCGSKSTDSGFDLNTRSRTHTGTFLEIERWDPVNAVWAQTRDKVPMVIEWRFVSAKELATGGYSVSVAYTILFLNVSLEPVDVDVSSFNFLKSSVVTLAEHRLDPSEAFSIAADWQETRSGFFDLALNTLTVTGEITRMELTGEAAYRP